jgi:hypothetical protein
MRLTRRWGAVAAVTAAVVVGSGVAWAANLAVSSSSLGGAALTTPAFYPSSMAITNVNKGTVGRIEKGDTMQVVFNRVIQNSSICAGAAQGTLSAAGFTFTLTNGGTGADTLTISGGTSCTALHFGSFQLGSGGYTASSISYTASTLAVAPGATTTTVTLTFGGTGSTNSATVSTATSVKYVPDPAMTDTGANAIGTNTTSTTSGVQF